VDIKLATEGKTTIPQELRQYRIADATANAQLQVTEGPHSGKSFLDFNTFVTTLC
jgi:hypothetical protein